jgi:FKBP-type peptidyl-prolyl cis-trans isomerase 2
MPNLCDVIFHIANGKQLRWEILDMAQAKNGDKVKVHYTGKFEDGEIFDTSSGREPLQFTLGSGDLISGFDQAVVGMNIEDKKTETIPPAKAYGDRTNDMIMEVEKQYLPQNMEPKVGMVLEMEHASGGIIPVQITMVNDNTVTIDANHPLAGKTLIFDIELVEIE